MNCKIFGNIRGIGNGRVLVSGDYYVIGRQDLHNTVSFEDEVGSITGLTANEAWDKWAAMLCDRAVYDCPEQITAAVTDVIWV